jgi:hypothetical protein
MKGLQTRLCRLEARYGTLVPLPWEMAGWEWWSEAEQMQTFEQYMAAYPQSRLARLQRDIATLSDNELAKLIAELQAQLGETI